MGAGETVKRSLIFLLLLACDRADAPSGEMREFVDVRGERVRFAWPPRRIVSIVPSSTELLYAVGAGDHALAGEPTGDSTVPPPTALRVT